VLAVFRVRALACRLVGHGCCLLLDALSRELHSLHRVLQAKTEMLISTMENQQNFFL
jgi:hypothetical protein